MKTYGVYAEYDRLGYTVYRLWTAAHDSYPEPMYEAGNNAFDSTQYGDSPDNTVPLKTIRRFCRQTTKDIARDLGTRYLGITRISERVAI